MSEERRYVTIRVPGDALPWIRDLFKESAAHCRALRERYVRASLRAALLTAAEHYEEMIRELENTNEQHR